ncbi:MAG: hypothetical protein KDB27_10735 [Planctomycetales bacterium]|nr:hypothetical protein [Planctomycetales bacterium]
MRILLVGLLVVAAGCTPANDAAPDQEASTPSASNSENSQTSSERPEPTELSAPQVATEATTGTATPPLQKQFRKIQLDYQSAVRDYRSQLRQATTAEQKAALLERTPDLSSAIESALRLFDGHEQDPEYLTMASWMIRTAQDPSPIATVLEVVKKHHLGSEQIAGFLLQGIDQNVPVVNSFVSDLSAEGGMPASMVARFLMASTLNPVTDEQRIVQMLQSVVEFQGNVTYNTVDFKKLADGKLFSILRLKIGEEVPDIVGPDQNGTEFKLSGYRGNVIMLDFWGDW